MTRIDDVEDDGLRAHEILAPLALGTTVIEASAGTGKTWTITSLYVRLVIEEGIGIERILALTFARAAAAELTSRVRDRLRQARALLGRARTENAGPLPDDPVLRSLVSDAGRPLPAEELTRRSARADAALETLDVAAIATIHGFCLDVRTRWAFDLSTTFGPRLVEDPRLAIADVVDDYLVRLSSQLDGPRHRRLRESAKLDRRSLRRLAATVLGRPDARTLPAAASPASTAVADGFEAEAQGFVAWWRGPGRADFLDEVAVARETGLLLDKTFGRGANGKELPPFAKRIAALEAALASPATELAFELAGVQLGEADFRTKLAPARELPTEGAWRRVMAFLERARSSREDVPRADFLAFFEREIHLRRQRANEIDHDDLLVDLRAALRSPASGARVLSALRGAYDVALIDEVQDTDQVQWDIFRSVFHEAHDKRLFLVGDPKQAIYGFRGADVRVYEAARAATAPERRSTLRESYRSDGALVHALDVLWRDRGAVFEEPAPRYVRVRAAAGVHPWTSLAREGRPKPAPLRFRWFDARTFDASSDRFALGKTDANALVPSLVAGDVVDLLRGGTTLGRGASSASAAAVAPRDIAVLVRTNVQAAAIKDALSAVGLPAVIAAAGNVFHAEEAGWLAAWLDALAEGTERRARAFALTPLGGFSVSSLYAAIEQEERDDTWATFLERLAEQRIAFAERGFAIAWRACLDAPHEPLTQLARTPSGERALTNLRQLEEHLHAQERALGRGVVALSRWLSEQRSDEGDDADDAELRLESDRDAVRITTVHRSKGLEYPIVLVPYAWDGALAQATGPTVFHERDAAGLPTSQTVIDARAGKGGEGRERHKRWAREESLAENLRLFYVASTRARQKLVLYAGAVTSHGDTGGLATSALGVLLFGGRDPHAAPGTRAALAHADIGRRLESNDRASFRSVVDDLAGLAERTRPPEGAGSPGPVMAWDDAPPRGTSRPRPEPSSASTSPEIAPASRLRIAPFTRGLALAAPSPLQRASYTSLTARAPHLAHRSSQMAPTPGDEVPLASFPRGPAVGIYVHALLERLDFRTARERDDERYPAPIVGGRPLATFAREEAIVFGVPEEAASQLADALPSLLQAPLGPAAGDVCLADLATADRLDELSFDLSVAGGMPMSAGHVERLVRGDELTALIAADPRAGEPPLPWPAHYTRLLREGALSVPSFAGLLTGSLDLVYRVPAGAEHGGGSGEHRYFVADYKTNWLGESDPTGQRRSVDAHYAPDVLPDEMVKHHYFIQATLYLVALHRFLRARLGASYAYDRHVGGAVYLFVRGLGVGARPGNGVYTLRPPGRVIEALDALLQKGSEP